LKGSVPRHRPRAQSLSRRWPSLSNKAVLATNWSSDENPSEGASSGSEKTYRFPDTPATNPKPSDSEHVTLTKTPELPKFTSQIDMNFSSELTEERGQMATAEWRRAQQEKRCHFVFTPESDGSSSLFYTQSSSLVNLIPSRGS
jgi:hypothetical protein